MNLAAAATLALLIAAHPTGAVNVVAGAADAVVTVQAGSSVGTGFAVRAGSIITAAHVVEGRETVGIVVDGQRYQAQVDAMDPVTDLALLGTSALELGHLELADVLPQLTDDVVAFSAADGIPAATRGIISAYETIDGVDHLRTDAAVNTGSSGGPILGPDGNVAGMTVAKAEGRDGIAYAVTASVIAEFLDGPPPGGQSAAGDTAEATGDSSSNTSPLPVLIAVALAGAILAAAARRRTARASPDVDDIRLGPSRIHLDANDRHPIDLER